MPAPASQGVSGREGDVLHLPNQCLLGLWRNIAPIPGSLASQEPVVDEVRAANSIHSQDTNCLEDMYVIHEPSSSAAVNCYGSWTCPFWWKPGL